MSTAPSLQPLTDEPLFALPAPDDVQSDALVPAAGSFPEPPAIPDFDFATRIFDNVLSRDKKRKYGVTVQSSPRCLIMYTHV